MALDRATRLVLTESLLSMLTPDGVASIVDVLTSAVVAVRRIHVEKDGACEHCSFLAAQAVPYPCPTAKAVAELPPCTCGKCEPGAGARTVSRATCG